MPQKMFAVERKMLSAKGAARLALNRRLMAALCVGGGELKKAGLHTSIE
jgi:hypothetical protein